MNKVVKSGLFQLNYDCTDDVIIDDINEFVSEYDDAKYEYSHNSHTHYAAECEWNSRHKIFSGTVWLERQILPQNVGGVVPKPLDDKHIGEPTSFAYDVTTKNMAIEYNHRGPRHSAVNAFFVNAFQLPIRIGPVLDERVLDRMLYADHVKDVEFSLSPSDDEDKEKLKKLGSSVSSAINMVDALNLVKIKVVASIDNDANARTENNLKSLAKKLAESFMYGVQSIKTNIKNEDEKTQWLNLLEFQVKHSFEVSVIAGELDRVACRNNLVSFLRR